LDGLLFGHARLELEEQAANPGGGVTGRILEVGELFDLVDHSHAVCGIDQQVGRIGQESIVTGHKAQVDDD
jgi:hypothetical protein